MPLYDFACPACGERFEASTAVDAPGPACPACGAQPTQRVITGFATSRSPGLKGAAARRSNDTRAAREEARRVRMAARREQREPRPGG